MQTKFNASKFRLRSGETGGSPPLQVAFLFLNVLFSVIIPDVVFVVVVFVVVVAVAIVVAVAVVVAVAIVAIVAIVVAGVGFGVSVVILEFKGNC